MAQLLGLGVTHSPPLLAASGDTASRIKRMIHDPLLPECYRSPATWPEPMRQQWGNDEGQTHARQHRDELVECMQWSRKQLDAFNPETRSGQFIPGVDVPSEVTGSLTTKWYVAVDQAIDSTATDLYVAFQHIEPEIDLVSRFDRDGVFSETGKLRKVPVSLTNFDVFWTGARIQF